MKKLLALGVTCAFLGSLILTPAFGATKAGATCSKAGSTSIVSGKKYICVRTGKKLTWDTGLPIAKTSADESKSAPAPTPTASPSPSRQQITYSVQWKVCSNPTNGHQGWVLGKNANETEFTFLRCTNSHNDDGSPTVIWQIPQDAAKIDQTSKLPISGTGYAPKVFSTNVTTPDWYFYTAENHPKAPTSFADLYQNKSGISYAVWSTIKASEGSFKGDLPSVQVITSNPRATYSNLGIQNLLILHKIMNAPTGIRTVRIYYFDRNSVSQVATQVQKDMGADEYEKGVLNQGGPMVQCYGSTDCNNSNAWATSDGTLYLFMGIANNPDQRILAGGAEPTEYFHAVWRFLYAKNNAFKAGPAPAIFPGNQPPYWENIGLEIISRNATSTQNDFRSYAESNIVDSAWIYQAIPDFSESWLNSYLDISNLGNRWSDAHLGTPNNTALIIGPKIMEILISLRGTPAFLDFYKRMSQGESFEAIFQDIYKTSWQEAQPILAKLIFEQLTE